MQINWFTVIAQIINFLILVGLLKRFLYKPILDAIDDRDKKIASQLESAEAKMTEAKKEKEEYLKKNDAFDQERKEHMEKAIAEAKEERQKMIDNAREEAKLLSDKLELSFKESRENLNREISEKIEEEVLSIARKTLNDLSSASLEEQMLYKFIQRLNELKPEEKKDFLSAFKSGSNGIIVQSAFGLTDQQKQEIKKSVDKILESENKIEFKKVPELVGGIEILANGYKIGWSISAYLNSFQKSISEISNSNTKENSDNKIEITDKTGSLSLEKSEKK